MTSFTALAEPPGNAVALSRDHTLSAAVARLLWRAEAVLRLWAVKRRQARTAAALRALPDHTLRDIGVDRYAIESVVRTIDCNGPARR